MTPPSRCPSVLVRRGRLFLVLLLFVVVHNIVPSCSALSLVMMGSRRGKKGNLKRSLDDPPSSLTSKKKIAVGGGRGGNKRSMSSSESPMNALNDGLGQEITGVTLPSDGTMKGWEFGNGVRMTAANVDGTFYVLQGDCPRCAFELFMGDVIVDNDPGGWDDYDLPRVACPTCGTTFSLSTGVHGPPLNRGGLAGWVGGLAKAATKDDEYKDAKAFTITRQQDGRVYLREK